MDIKKYIPKFCQNEEGNVGTVIMLVGVAVGILALAIVLTLGPSIGYSVGSSVTIPASSQWSSTAALNGSQLWINTTPMLGSGAMVVIAALIIAVLLGAFLYQRK